MVEEHGEGSEPGELGLTSLGKPRELMFEVVASGQLIGEAGERASELTENEGEMDGSEYTGQETHGCKTDELNDSVRASAKILLILLLEKLLASLTLPLSLSLIFTLLLDSF